jgi:hypothetical protein
MSNKRSGSDHIATGLPTYAVSAYLKKRTAHRTIKLPTIYNYWTRDNLRKNTSAPKKQLSICCQLSAPQPQEVTQMNIFAE